MLASVRHSREFQLHNLKRYHSPVQDVTVNSWVRFSSDAGKDGAAIRVEQDINTLSEELTTRAFNGDQIEEFFNKIPDEMGRILELYLPFGAQT